MPFTRVIRPTAGTGPHQDYYIRFAAPRVDQETTDTAEFVGLHEGQQHPVVQRVLHEFADVETRISQSGGGADVVWTGDGLRRCAQIPPP